MKNLNKQSEEERIAHLLKKSLRKLTKEKQEKLLNVFSSVFELYQKECDEECKKSYEQGFQDGRYSALS
jgi:hypothetical protein